MLVIREYWHKQTKKHIKEGERQKKIKWQQHYYYYVQLFSKSLLTLVHKTGDLFWFFFVLFFVVKCYRYEWYLFFFNVDAYVWSVSGLFEEKVSKIKNEIIIIILIILFEIKMKNSKRILWMNCVLEKSGSLAVAIEIDQPCRQSSDITPKWHNKRASRRKRNISFYLSVEVCLLISFSFECFVVMLFKYR